MSFQGLQLPADVRETHYTSLRFTSSFLSHFIAGMFLELQHFQFCKKNEKEKSALVRQQHSVISIPNKGLIHTHTHTYILLNFSLSMFVIDVVLAQ